MAKVNIKSEKITPFGGIYYASKASYALSLDKVINVCLPLYRRSYAPNVQGRQEDGRHTVRHNICISDAQYYELNAQQNLWCEILEF